MKLTIMPFLPQTAAHTKFIAILIAEERHDRERLTRTGHGKARSLTHARVSHIVDAGPDGPRWADACIAAALDISRETITRLRRSFVEQG